MTSALQTGYAHVQYFSACSVLSSRTSCIQRTSVVRCPAYPGQTETARQTDLLLKPATDCGQTDYIASLGPNWEISQLETSCEQAFIHDVTKLKLTAGRIRVGMRARAHTHTHLSLIHI